MTYETCAGCDVALVGTEVGVCVNCTPALCRACGENDVEFDFTRLCTSCDDDFTWWLVEHYPDDPGPNEPGTEWRHGKEPEFIRERIAQRTGQAVVLVGNAMEKKHHDRTTLPELHGASG